MQLYNNGYVVQGLYKNDYTSDVIGYRGIQEFYSWPLSKCVDSISKALEEEAYSKWFAYHDILYVVPEKDYLARYINHCRYLGIDTQILQIETPRNNQVAIDTLEIIEVLGFDCITGVYISYLNLEPDYFQKMLYTTYSKLNNNYICKNIDDTYEFLNAYERLLSEGENLEWEYNPVPARLSIAKI